MSEIQDLRDQRAALNCEVARLTADFRSSQNKVHEIMVARLMKVESAQTEVVVAYQKRVLHLEEEAKCLRYGFSQIIAECSQENCDGDPWDTFQEIALKARDGT